MIIKLAGQVNYISEPQEFGKTNKGIKITVAITSENSLIKNRVEYLPIDFINDNISKVAAIKVGDWINVDVELRGRKWVAPEDTVTKFHVNIEGLNCIIYEN